MNAHGAVLGKLLGGLALILIIVLAVSGVLGSYLNNKQETAQEPFRYDAYSDSRFARLGEGLLAVSQISIELFNGEGLPIRQQKHGYSEALFAVNGETAAVWSEGSSGVSVLRTDGEMTELTSNGVLIAVDVNSDGWCALLTEETGYKGAATIYRPDGEAVYKVYLGSSYPLDADISPSGDRVAVLSLVGDGSHVEFYALSKETAESVWNSETLFIDLEYLSDECLLLISTESAAFLNDRGELLGSLTYQNEYLKDYTVSGDGFVALVLGKYRTGNAGRIVTLDRAGNQLASLDISAEVLGLDAEGDNLLVQFSDQAVLYDSGLNKLKSIANTAGTQALFVRNDGSVIILTGAGADLFEP